uniref:Uncharacterized protein n=1 Tax=Pyrodinium bahamense TaxID=73915 RepID=A0A7S0FBJ4_9DINO
MDPDEYAFGDATETRVVPVHVASQQRNCEQSVSREIQQLAAAEQWRHPHFLDSGVSTTKSGLSPEQWQVFSTMANKWRCLLRTSQSLMAMCLYGSSTFLRFPTRPLVLQLLIALCLAPVFALAYHALSMNRAGSYYNNFVEMFTELPRLFINVGRRDTDIYRAEIDHEQREGIVRTVNGLESGLLFLLANWATLVAAYSSGYMASDLRWRYTETVMFFVLHRTLGANLLKGRYRGLLQPESMWLFQSDAKGADCHIRPLTAHPQPSY